MIQLKGSITWWCLLLLFELLAYNLHHHKHSRPCWLMMNTKYCKIWEILDANVKEQYFSKSGTCFLVCRALRNELIVFYQPRAYKSRSLFHFLAGKNWQYAFPHSSVGWWDAFMHASVCEMCSRMHLFAICILVPICWRYAFLYASVGAMRSRRHLLAAYLLVWCVPVCIWW